MSRCEGTVLVAHSFTTVRHQQQCESSIVAAVDLTSYLGCPGKFKVYHNNLTREASAGGCSVAVMLLVARDHIGSWPSIQQSHRHERFLASNIGTVDCLGTQGDFETHTARLRQCRSKHFVLAHLRSWRHGNKALLVSSHPREH